ncbi:MAG TPA: hypothetical protein VJU58_08665, partial [Microbacterium sp.]|nr:hypothetical protein [Microbacterium sp.]
LLMGNIGNAVYTVYVLSLPFGPIWILHGFYLTTMAIMLVLYGISAHARRGRAATPDGAATAVAFGHGGHGRRARSGTDGISVR